MPSPEEYQNLQERCSVLENEVKRLVKTEKKLYSIKRKYDKEIINLQKLQNLVHKLNLNFSLDEIVRIVCQALVYEFEYEKSMILLKEQNKFMIKAFTGYKEKETKMINISQINFDPVIDHLLRNQKALLIQKGGSFDPVGDHMGLSTFLISLLLTKENHIMGLLLAGISKEKLMLYSPLSEDDINLFSTLSEQVAASIENTKLYHDLKNAYEELKTTQNKLMSQESLAAIGKLASSVGHELRNPLESIKNVAYYFEKKLQPDNPTMKKFLEILKKEVVRANKIVTDILDFSRVKRLNKAMVSLNQLFQDILTSMDIDKRIKVNREIPPSVDNIYLDPDRIKQV
ncbi:MAG: hypothetical protein JW827_09595, partial [Spirochaetes bacterium]|nr:hypothetical protein [Spirochaetota bacterium]